MVRKSAGTIIITGLGDAVSRQEVLRGASIAAAPVAALERQLNTVGTFAADLLHQPLGSMLPIELRDSGRGMIVFVELPDLHSGAVVPLGCGGTCSDSRSLLFGFRAQLSTQ